MSAVFFLDERGRPLLHRNFKGDVPESCVDGFGLMLQEHGGVPCFEHRGVHYVYIKHADLIVLLVSGTAFLNAMAALHFLYKLVQSFEVFVKNVEVESVVDNFVVLYELLDEMLDFGIVQTTDANLLQDYVTQASYKLEVSQAVSALTNAVSWRPSGIWYKKNELFVDVVESIYTNLDGFSSEASAVNVVGKVTVRCFLSGMPKLTLALNDVPSIKGLSYHRASRHVVLNDVAFHQCVDLEIYEREHRIEFVPPDGQFDLLTYRVKNKSKAQGGTVAMFRVDPEITPKGNRLAISCKLHAQYRRRQQCRTLEVALPVPASCDSPRCRATKGSVIYVPERQRVVWRLRDVAGGDEAAMQAELLLSNMDSASRESELQEVRATPVTLKFEMPGSVLSGLHIRYLKIREEQQTYQALPWVRYITKSGEYEVRHAKTSENENKSGNNAVRNLASK